MTPLCHGDESVESFIDKSLADARAALEYLSGSRDLKARIAGAASRMAATFQSGGRVFSCGNGGSMCDAMHFAEEMSGRFRRDRAPLAALSISDPAHMSCVANDFSWEDVFARFITAHGRKDDVLLAISTSGKSGNVLRAAETARSQGMSVIALTGREGSPLAALADIEIPVYGGSAFADRIQELHIKVIHIVIEMVERELFPECYR